MHRRLPRALPILAGIGVLLVAVPLLGLLLEAPWSRTSAVLKTHEALAGLRLSLLVSTAAAAICVALGVPVAIVLARASFPGRRLVRGLVLLPLVLPPVVAGVGLLTAFGRRGLFGGPLEVVGVRLPFSTAGAVLAAAFVAFPMAVLPVEAGLRSLDERLEDAASTLGATPGTVLRRVTLPLLGPQLIAAALLSWARALGEFGATITFAGNLTGETQTLPLAVFSVGQTDPGGAIVLSLALVAISLAVLVALRGRIFEGPRR